MIVKLLTEHHLESLSLKGGCTGSSESTHVKMSNCWKCHALAQSSVWGRKSWLLDCCHVAVGASVSLQSWKADFLEWQRTSRSCKN